MRKGGGARARALDILDAVAGGAALDPLLDAALAAEADPREAGFLAELVRGTLQWQGRYDHVIAGFSRKRPPTDPVLLNILRLGLHQLLALDGVPPYAAIHEAGELARHRLGKGKVGFVNGLLQAVRRRLRPDGADAAAREALLRTFFADLESDRPRWLAAWSGLPQWLVTRWLDRHGPAAAERICAAANAPAPVHLRAPAGADPAAVAVDLAAAGLPAAPGPVPGSLVAEGRPSRATLRAALAAVPGVVVQDATVQEATAWLAAGLAADDPAGGPVLDMCAAPGGKAVHLAGIVGAEATLVAMDNRPGRVRLLADTLDRACPGAAAPLVADGAHPPFAPGAFRAILLDGPCSGTGVLRHHPDGRHRLKPGTAARKAATLLRLARQAADLLAPGGRLMYATCSLEPEENEDVLRRLREERPDLVPDPGPDGAWERHWWPGDPDTPAGGDGFYAARLVRSGADPAASDEGTGKTA